MRRGGGISRGWIAWAAVCAVSLACSDPHTVEIAEAADADAPLRVYVVNHPLAYFSQRIGGARVEVHFPAPTGVDPAHWSPDAETAAAYQRADLILRNGAGYAGWTARVSLPARALVDTSARFAERLIPLEEGVTHQHGPQGAHSHLGHAFSVWLDPGLALEQAASAAQAFASARPQWQEHFDANFAALAADLRALEARLGAAARELGGVPILFSHPVYQYFERRFQLNGRSLHWEPDEVPSERSWRELEAILESHPARLLLWEDEPLLATARRLDALGIRSVVFAPCGNAPAQGDWLSAMMDNAARLERATSEGSR
jgi:zinc transport system substrate-binding protein